MGRLDEVDLSAKISRKEQDERLAAAQERLSAIRLQLGGLIGDGRLGPPVCMLFEGWDASGKGGAIKRLTAQLDHRHVRVASFAAPTAAQQGAWEAIGSRNHALVIAPTGSGKTLAAFLSALDRLLTAPPPPEAGAARTIPRRSSTVVHAAGQPASRYHRVAGEPLRRLAGHRWRAT